VSITIANESTQTVTIGTPGALTNSMITADSCGGQTLAPRARCTVMIEFAPSADAGRTLSDSLTYPFSYGADNAQLTVALSGTVARTKS
jgi:hypothetical protein